MCGCASRLRAIERRLTAQRCSVVPASASAGPAPLRDTGLIQVLRDPPRKNGKPAPRACTCRCRPLPRRLRRHVADLVGHRFEHGLGDRLDAPRSLLEDLGFFSAREAASAGESGNRSEYASCIVSSTWAATCGPTMASMTEGAIGSPSRSTASSVCSTVFPCSRASMSTEVIRVSTRLTTNPGVSRTTSALAASSSAPRRSSGRVVGGRGTNELHERHQRDRVEEVQADVGAHLGDRERGRVQRESRWELPR